MSLSFFSEIKGKKDIMIRQLDVQSVHNVQQWKKYLQWHMGTFFSILVFSINDNKEKKTCSLYFAEYISILLSTEAVDLITLSAHLIQATEKET